MRFGEGLARSPGAGKIVRSKVAMMLLAGGAGTYALGSALSVIAAATLNPYALSSGTGLLYAAAWLQFVGSLAALGAVVTVAWEELPKQQLTALAELGGATVATLLVVLGALVTAVSLSSGGTGNVLDAVGAGGWALLALSRAGRLNLAEAQSSTAKTAQAPLWLLASGGLFLLAIGSGITPTSADQALGIVAGILQALGASALAAVFVVARSRSMLRAPPVAVALYGLTVVAGAYLVSAVAAGVADAPGATLTEARVWGSLTAAVVTAGVAVLGYAAWARVTAIVAAEATQPQPSSPGGGGTASGPPASSPAEPPSPPSPGQWPETSGPHR